MALAPQGGTPPLSDAEMRSWRDLIEKECGIDLDTSKSYLIQSRLSPLLPRFGLENLSQLYHQALNNRTLISEIVSAISTHETSFFRDNAPFELLGNTLIPRLLESRRSLRIWSAGCSTGQEPYSLAILCMELGCVYRKSTFSIVATDICAKSIEAAQNGVFSTFELERGLDDTQIERYFIPDRNGKKVVDTLRSMIEFRRADIFDPRVPQGPFDLVLCRNIAIYFSRAKRAILYQTIGNRLRPAGIVVMGSTESMENTCGIFRMLDTDNQFVYVRNEEKILRKPPA